jgi:type IV pilus assembly protein PilW
MMNRRNRQIFILKQRGLSLVELMIAISLGLFLIWGVTQSFLSSQQSYRLQQGVGLIQENGRLAQEFLGFDIRNAGDYGCGSGDDFIRGDADLRNDGACDATDGTPGVNMIAAVDFAANGFEYAVYGFDSVTGTAVAITDGTNTINLGLPAGTFPVAGSDVLVLRLSEEIGMLNANAGTLTPVLLTDLLGVANPFNLVTGLAAALPADTPVAVADCATTKVFAMDAAAVGDVALSPSGANYCGFAGFRLGASLRRLTTVYYFVAPSVSGNTTSLYRQMGEMTNAEELLQGVANMQLLFGLDGDADNLVESWQTANAVTEAQWNGWDWTAGPDGVAGNADDIKDPELIRAVRYSLLLVTENPVLGENQALQYNGAAVPQDGRLRQVFTSTVGIRSRLK